MKKIYKSKEEIIPYLFNNFSQKILEKLFEFSDHDFALFVFHELLNKRIYQCPLKDIKNDITTHFNNVLNQIKEEFSIVKPILEQKNNQGLLQELIAGTNILYGALNKEEVLSDKTMWTCDTTTAGDHIDDKAVHSTIAFILGGCLSYTSPKFIKSHNLNVVDTFKDIKNNTLYAYTHKHHWYLLLLASDVYNVIDIREEPYNEKLDYNVLKSFKHTYIALGIQGALEKITGVEGICGKVCIVINNYLAEQEGPITIEDILKIKNSLKTDLNFYQGFINKVISLIKEDNYTKDYYITNEYLVCRDNKTPDYLKTNVSHGEFIKNLTVFEHSNEDDYNIAGSSCCQCSIY